MTAGSPPPLLAPGAKIGDGGRYQIGRRIGRGGMAEVYKAIDSRLSGRAVAIKVLSPAAAEHRFAARMRELFVQEAQALSRINDDHVVAVSDFGISESGAPYMVMEYLRGLDLGAFLRAAKRLPVQEATDLMLAICSGVHACHLAGIIHRDLKPGNIFLSETPKGRQPKVLDFGVAKLAAVRRDNDSQRTDLVVGTPSYMSPEQAKGRAANELSDQYGIGALLFRCVSGRVYDGSPVTLGVAGHEGLDELLRRALDPDPARRFRSVHQLGQTLLPFGSQEARARWRPYYERLPQRFDPTTTGPFSFRDQGPAPSSETATVAAGQAATPSSAVSTGPTDPTILDPPSSAEKAATSLSPTTIEVLLATPPARTVSSHASGRVTEGGPAVLPPTESPASRLRSRILVSFALAALLVAGVAAKAVLRLTQGEPRHSVKRSAPVVEPGPPLVPPPPIASHPAVLPDPPAPERDPPSTGLPATTESHAAQSQVRVVPSVDSKTSLHHAHRHHAPSPPPPIEYGDDGLPLIH